MRWFIVRRPMPMQRQVFVGISLHFRLTVDDVDSSIIKMVINTFNQPFYGLCFGREAINWLRAIQIGQSHLVGCDQK